MYCHRLHLIRNRTDSDDIDGDDDFIRDYGKEAKLLLGLIEVCYYNGVRPAFSC